MCLDLGAVLRLRGYGETTYTSLRGTRSRLRGILADLGQVAEEDTSFLQTEIEDLSLTTRARNVLRRLGVSTIADLLALGLAEPPKVRGCGTITYQHLVDTQADLRGQVPAEEAPTPPDTKTIAAASAQAERDSWLALPFFSGVRGHGITAPDLHQSYLPNTAVEYLRLPKRASRVIRNAGIECLGQLLLTSWKDLLPRRSFGRLSLGKSQKLVAEFLRDSLDISIPPTVDYSSPNAFLASLVSPVLRRERERSVFLLRVGWGGEPRTLEDLGQEYGLTRERIRQIEREAQKKLTSWHARSALSPLREFIVGLLKESGPLLAFGSICRELQRVHHWDFPLNTKVIEKLLPAFPDLKRVQNEFVCLTVTLKPRRD